MVKRAGSASDVGFTDSHHVSGSKRSVRDRLGGNIDSSLLRGSQLNNKRYIFRNFTVVYFWQHFKILLVNVSACAMAI